MADDLKLKLNIAMGVEGDAVIEHFKKMAREISRLGNQVTLEVTRAIGAQTAGVGGPTAAVNAVTGGLATAATGVSSGESAENLRRVMLGLTESTKEVGEEMLKTDKKKQKLDKNLKKATDTTKGFAQQIVEMGGKLRSISRLFFYASLDLMQFANAILGPVMAGLRIWVEYEKALARVFVNVEAMGQDGTAAMNLLGGAIEEMAESWEYSQLEIAQAAAVLGQARIPIDDIINSLDDLAGIARVNFIQLDQAAQITLRIMRQFRISLEDATSEMWRMSAIAQHTGESIDNIVNAMGYATEGGQLLEYTFAEIATSMTLLTEKYGSASIAGRRLSTVFSRLMQVGEEYGIQLQALDGHMLDQREHIANLADYLDLIGDPIQQNQYLIALFGRTGADAARTLVDAFKEGRLDKVMQDTGDNMIDVMKDVAKSMEQLSYISITDLIAGVKDLSMVIAQDLAPAIKTLADDLVPVIANFTEFVRVNKELIIAVTALGLALAALATAIRIMGFAIEILVAISTLFVGLSVVGSNLAWVLSIIGVNVLGLSGGLMVMLIPLALIVAAILLIVGIVIGFVMAMEHLGKTVDAAGKKITFLSVVVKWLGSILKIVFGVLKLIAGILITIGLGIVAFGMFLGALIPTILEALGWLKPLIEFFDHLGNVLNDVGDALSEAGDAIFDFLAGFLPGSPTLAQRIQEVTANLSDMIYPLQATTQWSRRLSNSLGSMKGNNNLSIGAAVGEGVASGMAGAGQQGGITVYVDAAYVPDPEDLAKMIASETVRESKRAYRRGPY